MAEVKWIKLATDIFNNRKIRQIERMPKGDSYLVIWFKLLTLAGIINDGGAVYVTPEVPYDTQMLADELGRKAELVKGALDVFEKFGMITRKEGEPLRIPGWAEHQNLEGLDLVREQNRLRKQAQRSREKSQDGHVTRHVTSRDGHAAEEEEEGEKEKEIHSFTLNAREAEGDFGGENAENSASDRAFAKRECIQGALGKGVVLMSDEQMDDLLDRLSVDEFNHYVSVVAEAELNGKRYRKKTHYQAILDMAEADRSLARRRA